MTTSLCTNSDARDALIQKTASEIAVQVLIEERDRLREALHRIALESDGNTARTMGYHLGRVHQMARKALDG